MDSPDRKQREALRDAVSQLCDGTLSIKEAELLDDLLCESAELRREYISLIEVHDQLQSHAVPWRTNSILIDEKRTPSWTRKLVRYPYALAVAAAASLLVIACVSLIQQSDSKTTSDRDLFVSSQDGVHVADIQDISDDGQFVIDGSGPDERKQVHIGDTLRLSDGRLRVDLLSGVKITMKGPAAITFVSDNRVRALFGGMKATVSEAATGFTILTPVADVIDRGTVLGVNVKPTGSTDVAVFAGLVDVAPTAAHANSSAMMSLRAGDAVHLDHTGETARFTSIDDSLFPNFRKTRQREDRKLIIDAYDNLDPLGRNRTYNIGHGIMDEDAKAYSDRIAHEWNGVNLDGLPAYLVGGDYVSMYNDYRNKHDFQMTLKVADAATLYVLHDTAAPVPQWLERDFESTGDYIGLDAGPSRDHGIEAKTLSSDVGPAESIDRQFLVWRQVVEGPRDVRLGPNVSLGEQLPPGGVDMYGVVVKATERGNRL